MQANEGQGVIISTVNNEITIKYENDFVAGLGILPISIILTLIVLIQVLVGVVFIAGKKDRNLYILTRVFLILVSGATNIVLFNNHIYIRPTYLLYGMALTYIFTEVIIRSLGKFSLKVFILGYILPIIIILVMYFL